MAIKPTKYHDWSNAGTEPGSALKLSGYAVGQTLPSANVNYDLNLTDRWIKWLAENVQAILDGGGGGGGGSLYWGNPAASAGDLPGTGLTGEIRLALDSGALYKWSGSAWVLYLDVTALATTAALSSHTGNTSNPHSTTKSQVGLGNADNTSDASKPVSTLQAAADAAVQAFAIDRANHTGTQAASTVGLGNVDNTSDVNKPVSTAQAAADAAVLSSAQAYADAVAQGLDAKLSVVAATTANITLSGAQTIDGVSVVATNRVLVKNQSTQSQNGIYVAAVGAWTRAADMDAWAEVPGAFVFVEQGGTINGASGWVCIAAAGGTIGSTSIPWTQFSGAGTYTADGQGLELTGTQFSLELDGSTLSKSASGLKIADLGVGTSQLAVGAVTGAKLGAMTSAELRAAISDETGSGSAVFGTSPAISTPNLDGGTASASSMITLPKAALATLLALARKQGNAFFCTDLLKILVDDGTNLVAVGSSGIKSYVKNPNDASANWTASDAGITVATHSTASNLPDNATQTTGIIITRVSGNTSYAYTRWTMDAVDYTVLGQIILDAVTAAAAGAYEVQLWTNTASNYGGTSTQVTLSALAIPTGTSKFAPTGAAGSSAAPYMELRIVARTAAGTTPIYLNNVTYTPTVVYSGLSPSAEWQSITFATPTNLGAGSATVTAFYSRMVNTMLLKIQTVKDATPGSGASGVAWTMPTGFTIDTSKLPSNRVLGSGSFNGTNYGPRADVRAGSSTTFSLAKSGAATSFTGADFTANGDAEFDLVIPILEWAGQTLTQGAGANVEYASSTTGTWDAAAAAGNTVSGTAGSPISGSLTAARAKVVRFQYPVQAGDRIVLQYQYTSGVWVDAGESNVTLVNMPSISFGAYVSAIANTTDVTVSFSRWCIAGTTYNDAAGTAATNWGTAGTPTAWRLIKANPTAPVGVKLAGTDGSPGYAQAGSLPGSVTGVAIAAGMVGQLIESVSGAVSLGGNGVYTDLASVALTPGVWLINSICIGTLASGTGMTIFYSAIGTVSGNTAGGAAQGSTQADSPPPTAAYNVTVSIPGVYVNISSNTTYYLKGLASYSGGTPTARGRITAVRIA